MRITIGLGHRRLTSADDGASWQEDRREVPAKTAPLRRGIAAQRALPADPALVSWDEIVVRGDGLGLATAHEVAGGRDRRSRARVWRTVDAGASWREIDLSRVEPGRPSPAGMDGPEGWPPERFESVALPGEGLHALTWTDPWLHDGADSHVLATSDEGATWSHRAIPGIVAQLAVVDEGGRARLRVFGAGRFWESADGRSWFEHDYAVTWPDPPPPPGDRDLLRQVHLFGQEGYALVVRFPAGGESPPRVGLARSQDGGMRWTVIQSWTGPTFGDVNQRHALTLEVGEPTATPG